METYFQNRDWPRIAAAGVIGATVLAIVLMLVTALPAPGYSLDPATSMPTGEILPGTIRLLTPFLNITGGLALILGALFSAYVFMPKRRVLGYSLDPGQKGDEFLFNLLIAPVAIVVNFFASLPVAVNAHPRPAPLARAGHDPHRGRGRSSPAARTRSTASARPSCSRPASSWRSSCSSAGFVVSIEVFREIRIPFTAIRLATGRHERTALTPEMAGAGATSTDQADGRRPND